MAKKGKISKPMQVFAIRLSEEERATLERIAEEHDVTISWVLRQAAKLYAEDVSKALEERLPRRARGELTEGGH
jgi:predicted transcriptional regulator